MIRIGVDTGAHLALVAMEFGAGKPRFVHKQEIEVGHSVKLARPRTNKIGRIQLQENVIDDDDLERMRIEFDRLLGRFPAQEVVIERVRKVVSRARFGASMATGISDSQWIGGEIAGWSRCSGLAVTTVRASDWRKSLVGVGSAKDPDISPIVRTSIEGWPKMSSKHVRDAAGLVLFAARAAQVAEASAAQIRLTSRPRFTCSRGCGRAVRAEGQTCGPFMSGRCEGAVKQAL